MAEEITLALIESIANSLGCSVEKSDVTNSIAIYHPNDSQNQILSYSERSKTLRVVCILVTTDRPSLIEQLVLFTAILRRLRNAVAGTDLENRVQCEDCNWVGIINQAEFIEKQVGDSDKALQRLGCPCCEGILWKVHTL